MNYVNVNVSSYRTATATCPEDLDKLVNKMLKRGYVPHGPMAIAANHFGAIYCQPMVRLQEERQK